MGVLILLPVLGRGSVGKSEIISGSHLGIFPEPAGHCGGHSHTQTGSEPVPGRAKQVLAAAREARKIRHLFGVHEPSSVPKTHRR